MQSIELKPTGLLPCKHRTVFADVNIPGFYRTAVTAIVHFEDLMNVEGKQGVFVRFRRTKVDPSRTPCCTHETVGKATIQILGGSNICGVPIGGTCFCAQAPEQ